MCYFLKTSWLITVCLAVGGPTSYGQSVVMVDSSFRSVKLRTPFLRQLREKPTGFPSPLPGSFTRWEPLEAIDDHPKQDINWVRFAVHTDQPRRLWLEIKTHFQDSVGVWMTTGTSKTQRNDLAAYRQRTVTAVAVKHRYSLYELDLPANETATVWVRGYPLSRSSIIPEIRLWQPGAFLTAQQADIWNWAAFVGCVLTVLSGVVIAFLLYQRAIYLIYAGYIGGLTVYIVLREGWGIFLPPQLAWLEWPIPIVHWLNVGLGMFVLFSRHFLVRVRRLLPRPFPGAEFVLMLLISGSLLGADSVYWTNQKVLSLLICGIGCLAFAGYAVLWLTYTVNAFQRDLRFFLALLSTVTTIRFCLMLGAFLSDFGLITLPVSQIPLKLALLAELMLLAIGWLYRQKTIQKAHYQLEQQNQDLQADLIQTQEAERNRLAADLHDDLGGTLATIRQRLSAIRQQLIDPQAAQNLDDLEPLIQKSGHDLRRIAHNLMPPDFDRLGLRAALEQFIHSQPAQPTLFALIVAGQVRSLPVEVELNLYRIVSEAVQNIHKHAQAKQAAVQLLYQTDQLTITVEDDGIGSQTAGTTQTGSGLGLKNSSLRAQYIGATLRHEASPAGTFVALDVPYLSTINAVPRKNPNSPDRRPPAV